MTAGNDLLLGCAGRKLKDSNSVSRHMRQERGKLYFAVAERQVIVLRAPAIVDVTADQPRLAQPQRLLMRMPAHEFLARGMAEIVPVTDHLGRKGVEHLRKLLLVGKFLENLADLKTKPDLVLPRHGHERVEAFPDPGPDLLEILPALPHRLDLQVGVAAVCKTR